MKKTALVLTLCIMLSLCSIVFAETSGTFYEKYGIWFDKETGTVTGFEEGITDLTIPSNIDGKKITTIGEGAFLECETLERLVLPNTVTKIDNQAFAGCTALKELTLSENITRIGDESFAQCTALETFPLPRALEFLGNRALMGCNNLTEIICPDRNRHFSCEEGVLFDKKQTLLVQYPAGSEVAVYTVPETVTSVGSGAFSYCSALTDITLPETLSSIGEYAFFNCDNLTEITLPDSVTKIGQEAFGWCDSLQKVTLPKHLTSIEYGLFWFAKSLEEIHIPDSVTAISDYAFSRCESLSSVSFPEGIRTLGEESFAYCNQLTEIVLPKTLTKIGNKAFCDTNLFRVTVKNGETVFGEGVFEGCQQLQFFAPEHTTAQQYALDRGDEWEKIVTVTYLGHEIQFDQPPVTRYDRTLVPVRAIFETMGAEVSWDEETQTVTAVRKDRTLTLQLDNQTMTVNGEAVVLDVPPQQINDRTLVPVRAVADGLHSDIYWDENTQTVSIWEKPGDV